MPQSHSSRVSPFWVPASGGACSIHYDVFEPDGATRKGGPPIVLLQGLGLSSRYWFDVPRRVADRGRRVIVIDNRGTGQSGRARGPYRMRDLADDVVSVLDHAGIDRAIVCGISLGGMIAQQTALRHPSRVAGLVLLATTPGLPHGVLAHPRTIAKLLHLPIATLRDKKAAARLLVELLLVEADWPAAKEIFSEWPTATRSDPTEPATFFAQLVAAMFHSTGRDLHRIACPTLVVTGDGDVLIPPKNSRVLASRIPSADLEIVPGAGHGIFAKDRDLVASWIERLAEKCA